MLIDLLGKFLQIDGYTFVGKESAGAFSRADIVNKTSAQQLNTLASCHIFQHPTAPTTFLGFVSGLVVRSLQNELCHAQLPRMISSTRIVPLVSCTSRMACARSSFTTSSGIS